MDGGIAAQGGSVANRRLQREEGKRKVKEKVKKWHFIPLLPPPPSPPFVKAEEEYRAVQ